MQADADNDGVTHGDGVLLFFVPSRTVSGETYLVDLNIHHPQCQCRFWVCNVAPALRRGERPTKYCHHHMRAHRAFAQWSLKQFSDHEQKADQKK